MAAVVACALPGGAAAAKTPLATAAVASCSKGAALSDRTAVFRGGMRRVLKARKLSMRFTLQERGAAGDYAPIDAPGLGVWRTSKERVPAFTYRQRVKALAIGSSYRVVIEYRWLNARGKVIKHARRTSRACRQAEALPNLVVQKVSARRIEGRPKSGQYVATIVNRGTAPAPASNVRLIVDGSTAQRASVPGLAVGQLARVIIVAPRCSSSMGAQADPDDLVRESKETDNTRTAACPF